MHITNEAIFFRRTANIYANQKKRAKALGTVVHFKLHEYRTFVMEAIPWGCPYCKAELTHSNFATDHTLPVARRGQFTLANMTICCDPCNRAKGILAATEYQELMTIISRWEPLPRHNLLTRLRMAGKIFRGML